MTFHFVPYPFTERTDDKKDMRIFLLLKVLFLMLKVDGRMFRERQKIKWWSFYWEL